MNLKNIINEVTGFKRDGRVLRSLEKAKKNSGQPYTDAAKKKVGDLFDRDHVRTNSNKVTSRGTPVRNSIFREEVGLKEYYKDKLNTKLNENIQEGAVGDLLKSAGRAIWNKAKTIPSLIATQVQKKLSTGDYSAMGIIDQLNQRHMKRLANDPTARRSGVVTTLNKETGRVSTSSAPRKFATIHDKTHKEPKIK